MERSPGAANAFALPLDRFPSPSTSKGGGGDRAPSDLRPQRHPHPSARKMLRIPECLLRNHRGDALMFRTKHYSSSL